MLEISFEEHDFTKNGLPFVLYDNIVKTPFTCRKEQNWHEDIEIQLCTKGEGFVIINGECFEFKENDIAVANSNSIHYTGTKDNLTYVCLIISADFCGRLGFNINSTCICPLFTNSKIASLILDLAIVYNSREEYKTAILNRITIEILIELFKNKIAYTKVPSKKDLESMKNAIKFIRENYSLKISLENISSSIGIDRFSLCKKFKKYAGITVFEYINKYRCQRAAEYIIEGKSISESAYLCGFENLSFFTKTFKKLMGELPSAYKNRAY